MGERRKLSKRIARQELILNIKKQKIIVNEKQFNRIVLSNIRVYGKGSFKARIKRQKKIKGIEKQIKEIKEKPIERIRRSLTKQFRQSEKPYYSYIMAITINPTITMNGLIREIEEAEVKLKRLYPQITASGSYLAPEYQQLAPKEEIQLNDYLTHVIAIVIVEKNVRITALEYTT